MEIQKINWKIPFKNSAVIHSEEFFKIFNEWIPESPEIFIDVADYKHVSDGPWVWLSGYHVDYALDHLDRTLGFLYSRKSPLEGSPVQKIRQTLEAFYKACVRLESHPLLLGKDFLALGSLQLIINDRALAPCNQQTFDALLPFLKEVLTPVYGESAQFKFIPNPRKRFSVTLESSVEKPVSKLLEALMA